MNKSESLKLVEIIFRALDEKKASDIKILDIEKVTPIADYFVIASGSNENQVQAMMDNVDEKMSRSGYEMNHLEGFHRGGWVLLDYGNVVVHIFDEESRAFYDLDRIWKDGEEVDPAQFAPAKED
ncbi:MAG: ribosome silencing factor [Lachnospiraceae bacterium]|nr:ribosome silencing factor [Lachnospiraceae bacterium]